MNSHELVESLVDYQLTYRKLDHWCRTGVLGPGKTPGEGYRRDFTDDEVRTIAIIARVAAAFRVYHMGSTDLYREIAAELVYCENAVVLDLAPGFEIRLDLAEMTR